PPPSPSTLPLHDALPIWGFRIFSESTMTTQDASPTTEQATVPRRVERYDPTAIEPRWQQRWEQLGHYRTDLSDTSRPKFYLLTIDRKSTRLNSSHVSISY